MKKRIISLILVVALSVLALASCGYKYEKDDMSKYATFDKAKFLEDLQKIEIKDADFGTDEAKRLEKVEDKIFSNLASKADTDKKITTGVAGKYDVLYYCYYATAEIDGETHIFFASKMEELKPSNLQLGLSSLEGLNLKIAELVSGKTLDGFIYSTTTALTDNKDTADVDESLLKAGDVVYVTYSKKITSTDAEGKVSTETVAVSYERIVLADGTETLATKLIGKAANGTTLPDTFEFGTEGNKTEITGVKVNWIVKAENEIGTIVDTTYTATKSEKDINGKSCELKDVALTYHIFPVYCVDVADELTAELVLEYYYQYLTVTDSRETDTKYVFECMDAGFKNGDKTLLDLANELSEKRTALSTAEKTEKDAQSVVDKQGTNATEAEKTALADAKKATEEAKAAVNETVNKILGATNEAKDDVKAALVKGVRDYQYYSFEVAYENAIVKNIATEVFALANKYITYKTDGDKAVLPKKAVKAAYERIENGHKLEFYTGNFKTSSSTTNTDEVPETNYRHYNGDYNAFLLAKYPGTKSIDEVEAKITAAAEDAVRDIVFVYTLKSVFDGSADLDVSKEQEEEFELKGGYWLLEYQYGKNFSENDYMPALVFDNIFNYLLERKDNVDNKLVFEHLNYTFKTEEADSSND